MNQNHQNNVYIYACNHIYISIYSVKKYIYTQKFCKPLIVRSGYLWLHTMFIQIYTYISIYIHLYRYIHIFVFLSFLFLIVCSCIPARLQTSLFFALMAPKQAHRVPEEQALLLYIYTHICIKWLQINGDLFFLPFVICLLP